MFIQKSFGVKMKYDYSFNINADTAPSYIARRINKNSKVLEFGTAHGILTKYLKEELNCTIYGVEIDEECAEIAREYTDKFHVGDIECFNWVSEFSGEKFDYIIFSDVLEHLYNPHDVLLKAKELMKEDGLILLSLPNVSHNSIVIELLDDSFDYRRTGLLDNTHIRFFTEKSIKKFVKNTGLNISYETGVYIQPSLTEFKKEYSSVTKGVSDFLRKRTYGEVYQFVLELSNNECDSIVNFNKKYSGRLSFNVGNGFNEKDVVNIKSDYNDSFSFELENSKKINEVHIYLDESPTNFRIKSLEVNGEVLTGYTTNAEWCDGSLCAIDESFELYFKFNEPLDVLTVNLKLKFGTEKEKTIRDLINRKNEEIMTLSNEVYELKESRANFSVFNIIKNIKSKLK